MVSQKQRKVAQNLIENLTLDKPKTSGEIVESSGYGKSMRLFPGRILESKGVKEELRRLGFSIEAADQVIWKLLHTAKKEDTKIKAAQEVYKRMGAYEDTKQGATKTLTIQISGETAERYGLQPSHQPEDNSKG